MTRDEAKRELKPIKEMESRVRSIEQEIERLMAVATKMTPTYDGDRVSGTPKNRIEEAAIKIEEYRGKLAKALIKSLDHKNKCLNKVEKIERGTFRTILILYYFQNKTLEQVAEEIERSYQWTYEMFTMALDEYAKIA
jgi:hypothetical protein